MCNAREPPNKGFVSRDAFTNQLGALGDAGMHNYHSELMTSGQKGKGKQ